MIALALFVALVSTAAMYAAATRMFADARFGFLAAGIFALTPLLWSLGLAAPTSLLPLPFVLGWILASTYSPGALRPWWALAAGGCLGAGVYSSNAAAVMMPLFALVTVALFAHARSVPRRHLGTFVAAFLIVAAPFAVSLGSDPDRLRATINSHGLYDANRFNVLQGTREIFSWVGLTARSEVYWDYLNPAFLFLSGGVLLLPLIVFVPAGVIRILMDGASPLARLSLAGVLVSPFAASLTAEAPIAARALFMTPFAALVSAYGVDYVAALWQRSRKG